MIHAAYDIDLKLGLWFFSAKSIARLFTLVGLMLNIEVHFILYFFFTALIFIFRDNFCSHIVVERLRIFLFVSVLELIDGVTLP